MHRDFVELYVIIPKLLNKNSYIFLSALANGISQRNLIATQSKQLRSQLRNYFRRNRSFIRTVNYSWKVSSDSDVILFGNLENFFESKETFLLKMKHNSYDWAINVFLRKRLRSCTKDGDFLDSGFDSAFETFLVRNQARVRGIGPFAYRLIHLRVIS